MRTVVRLLFGVLVTVTLVLVHPAQSPAQTGDEDKVMPLVRIDVDPDTVSVGQAARLRVTVLVPTWFTTPTVYPSFEKVNVITRLPPDSSFPTNERVGGESWSGVSRDYQLFPQAAASYEFQPGPMVVTYADPDTQKPVKLEVAVPPFSITGTVPEGAESLNPFLISESAELEQSIEGETESIAPGDAVVRTVVATIVNMPAMFLPSLLMEPGLDGVSVYPRSPTLDEKTDSRQGTTTSTRTESATYVFEQPGEFRLPGIDLSWWNPKTKQIQSVSVPEVAISVAGTVASGDGAPAIAESISWHRLAALLIPVAAIVLLAYRLGPRGYRYWQARLKRRRESEPYRFRQLLNRIEQGDKESVYGAMMEWWERVIPDQNYREPLPQPGYEYDVQHLARDLFGAEQRAALMTTEERQSFRKSVESLRLRINKSRDQGGRAVDLPLLNP